MEKIDIITALKYPFNRPKRLLYALWILVPIIGWLALFGYVVRIVNEFIEGKYEELPQLHFTDDLKLGFSMFLKSLPFYIVYAVLVAGIMVIDEDIANILSFLLGFFVLPILSVNFYRKQTVGSYFDFGKLGYVMNNIGDYIIAMLKQYATSIIFLVLSIVLIGIPALYVTSMIFAANFYGRFVEEQAEQVL
ncbi:MAG: DUF4013 domain-containing protein [Methanosarcina sp.]|jgi:hypothetical protein|nr:DUF4013 domain-containing protein [Methanosarcina sp.]MDD3316660.1 DUF4013 domain-containing protein [Methanosarcina sp.]MDD4306210.1 DUF4013 domain-containing protein [Methanosarcina sp.]MDD4620952.1 DUF4013 domain-containing protein [Methanosarcina sp.]NLN42809.1 DUF4013 domain-containing protein [Methanosarcina sp.]